MWDIIGGTSFAEVPPYPLKNLKKLFISVVNILLLVSDNSNVLKKKPDDAAARLTGFILLKK